MGELIAALVMLLVPRAEPCAVLGALDVVRAEAWSRGDPGLLAEVYAGEAGRADVARLTRWRERGIEVRGMRSVHAACEAAGPASARVVQRLGPTAAVLPDGSRRALPQDAWDRRRVELVQVRGRWRIARVR
ncbi:hypothetical protein [Aeromicrobium sp. 179-A 4D2 NHS]|uniref:hypothetical protein n=1 Tax=Aeromicrobium sp. 179-A 4D2 NHS TaxID=3142375 RepID=UPI0039A3945C